LKKLSLAKGKIFTEKLIFLKENLWKLLDARDLHIFESSVKFRFF